MQTQLIVALDFNDRKAALALVDELDPAQCMLKVGSELFTLFGVDFVRELMSRQFRVFLDLKFHDIPNTVARASKTLADLGVWMFNVHASGGFEMMQAAKNAISSYSEPPLLIAVTVLTSMSQGVLHSMNITMPLKQHVLYLAKMAHQAGLDGVVCSAHECEDIKVQCGPTFLAVTPGIRLSNDASDDQSRIMTPELALKSGSDYWVVGRPITRASNPKKVVTDLLAMMRSFR